MRVNRFITRQIISSSIALFSFLFFGCSTSMQPSSEDSSSNSNYLSSSEEADNNPVPLSLSIAQAFIVEDQLHVKVRVDATEPLNTDEVIIGITGLNNGQVTEQQFKRLSDVSDSSRLESGSALALNFTLQSAGITEYQVRCSWGDDAAKLAEQVAVTPSPARAMLSDPSLANETALASKSMRSDSQVNNSIDIVEQTILNAEKAKLASDIPNVVMPNEGAVNLTLAPLRISKKISPCQQTVCDFFYTVDTTMANNSNVVISKVVLAVGLNWVTQGQSNADPDHFAPTRANEDELVISNLRLNPDETRPVRINIDKPVPSVPGGSFMPTLRIVRIESY